MPTAQEMRRRQTAMFSYDGREWFEADDPFAPESSSDEEGAGRAHTTARTYVPPDPSPDRIRNGHSGSYATARTPTRPGAAIPMEILAVAREGEEDLLLRPCVDCGRRTGSFCDHCLAADRLPEEEWVEGQQTPLCTVCDRLHNRCHFCRGLTWARPPQFGV